MIDRILMWLFWIFMGLATACYAAIPIGLIVDATAPAEAEVRVSSYRDAVAMCNETWTSPWDVSSCEWDAYESFYGTDAATAAWADKVEAR